MGGNSEGGGIISNAWPLVSEAACWYKKTLGVLDRLQFLLGLTRTVNLGRELSYSGL